jgi:hypothetical protein
MVMPGVSDQAREPLRKIVPGKDAGCTSSIKKPTNSTVRGLFVGLT